MSNILLVDLSSAFFPPSSNYSDIYRRRLVVENIIMDRWNPQLYLRGDKTYSRGLLIIAAALENDGHQVRYLHLGFEKKENILPILTNELNGIDIIGVGCVTPTFPLALEVLEIAKSIDPGIISVLGGPHVTYLDRQILRDYSSLVDIIVRHQGENAFREIGSDLRSIQNINDITYLTINPEGENIVRQTGYQQNHRQKEHFTPAYHLLSDDISSYAHNIITAWGCVYQCSYCIDGLFKPEIEYYPIEKIIYELKYLSERVPDGTLIHFSDSILNINKKHFYELLDSINKAGIRLSYSCDMRVKTITMRDIELMKSAGFVQYCVGIENSNDELLYDHKQKQLFGQSIEACQLIRNTHPEAFIVGYWITGLPGTTRENLDKDRQIIIDLIGHEIVNRISNKIFVPYPGTQIYDHPSEYGIKINHRNWSEYLRNRKPVYDLDKIDADQLYSIFIEMEQDLLNSYCVKHNISKSEIDEFMLNGHLARQYFDQTRKTYDS